MKNTKTIREQLVGDYEFLKSVSISCYIDDILEPPTISVIHDFYPEIVIEQVKE